MGSPTRHTSLPYSKGSLTSRNRSRLPPRSCRLVRCRPRCTSMTSLSPARRPRPKRREYRKEFALSFAKTPPGGQVIDLSAPIRRQSRLDDHTPSPLAPSLALPLRRPPSARLGELRPAPAACRLQTNRASAQTAHDGSPLVGRAGQSLGRLEAGPGPSPKLRPVSKWLICLL